MSPDILVYLFGYLNTREMAQCSLVCKEMNRAAIYFTRSWALLHGSIKTTVSDTAIQEKELNQIESSVLLSPNLKAASLAKISSIVPPLLQRVARCSMACRENASDENVGILARLAAFNLAHERAREIQNPMEHLHAFQSIALHMATRDHTAEEILKITREINDSWSRDRVLQGVSRIMVAIDRGTDETLSIINAIEHTGLRSTQLRDVSYLMASFCCSTDKILDIATAAANVQEHDYILQDAARKMASLNYSVEGLLGIANEIKGTTHDLALEEIAFVMVSSQRSAEEILTIVNELENSQDKTLRDTTLGAILCEMPSNSYSSSDLLIISNAMNDLEEQRQALIECICAMVLYHCDMGEIAIVANQIKNRAQHVGEIMTAVKKIEDVELRNVALKNLFQ
ncbi:MAG: F-box protein [Verrucomicrobiota bacterium]|nr:F-box protein [Verrucomicrobiota bacterium]